MWSSSGSQVTASRFGASKRQKSSILLCSRCVDFMPLGMYRLVRASHLRNILPLLLKRQFSGSVMDSRDEQPAKANSPIELMLLGILRDLSEGQLVNKPWSIESTMVLKETDFNEGAVKAPCLLASTQPTLLPVTLILAGMCSCSRDVHPAKMPPSPSWLAFLQMVSSLFGNWKLVSDSQSANDEEPM